ncbi:hypothetical protein CJD36_017995 [Flavipsychrobacter stenotrophus]|uniref:histidine kinase n=1 Tax=Flavipsychrobacter stenotrophus TaxID=2077091 RepID=A0A2S7STH1_9BACT|nr:PAS domain S-box protein [Flavipsychrobacter stenotrophus]PQJ09816.1 hypothetical protein CJD36_017995 [Flavipsychrobacter stenotrophus]
MSKLRLLLLEEDEIHASRLRTVFEASEIGYNVSHVQAHSGFLEALEADNHDVILSGNFKEQEGVSGVIKTIKAQGKNIPYIIITNPISEEYAVSLMKAGTFNYVLKERLEKLPGAILRAIEKYKLSETREQFLNDILPREAFMNEAERIARFGSWKIDVDQNTTWWSDENYRILGYEPGEVAASWEHFFLRVHPEDLEFAKNVIDEAIKNHDKKKYAFRVLNEAGTVSYIHAEIFITRDSDFIVRKINGFLRDMSDQVNAEKRSVEHEEKYFNLFENNPCPLTVIDVESRVIMDVNVAAQQLHGYGKGDMIPATAHEPMHNSEYVLFAETATTQPKQKGIWKITRKDGSILLAAITSTEIIVDGKPCKLILSEDISDRLNSITRLKESEARLLNSQRIAHIGSWETDLNNGGLIKWSEESYRIFGVDYPKETITADLFLSIVHPDDHKLLDEAVANAIANGGAYNAEFRIILRNGVERLVSELGELIFDPITNAPKKLVGTAQDITERRNARLQLQKSEANLRSIFENAHTAYVLLDSDLKIVSFNKPALRFSTKHLDKDLVEGAQALNYFSDTTLAVVRKSLRDALNGANINYEVSYPDESGDDKWYYANFHPVRSDDKDILGVIMSLRDITGRKTSELQEKKITSELIQRNKDLEQFAYIISHNLRAPVANIMGISDALKEGYIEEEEEKEVFMTGLFDSAKKLDIVITDLNRILQLKHGLNENKEKVHFSTLVNDIKFTISGVGENDMFQVKCDFSAVDEMITLKSYLHSIFYNLISNSIKYKRPGIVPVIEISSAKIKGGLVLTFSDNGLGIDMEKNGAMLFGLYKRFNSHVAEGKGMGLFMVKTQAETLGGKISVKSRVNHGTEFRIEFAL